MAGHSKWANIKHRKARQDAKKGKQWSKASRAIMAAVKNAGGDTDPETNLALRYAIDDAKSVNMPKENIERAIKKGAGEDGGASYEEAVYEGYGPNGVAMLVQTLTDNRNRTVGELRHVFDKHGGKLGTSGSVAFMFSQRGIILVPRDAADEETIMETVLDAGADDVEDGGDAWQITTDAGAYRDVRQAVEDAGIPIEHGEVAMVPANTVECTGETAQKVMNLVEAIEDLDDVQKLYANYDIPEQEMAALEG